MCTRGLRMDSKISKAVLTAAVVLLFSSWEVEDVDADEERKGEKKSAKRSDKASASSRAWLAPWPELGCNACAASPMRIARPPTCQYGSSGVV